MTPLEQIRSAAEDILADVAEIERLKERLGRRDNLDEHNHLIRSIAMRDRALVRHLVFGLGLTTHVIERFEAIDLMKQAFQETLTPEEVFAVHAAVDQAQRVTAGR